KPVGDEASKPVEEKKEETPKPEEKNEEQKKDEKKPDEEKKDEKVEQPTTDDTKTETPKDETSATEKKEEPTVDEKKPSEEQKEPRDSVSEEQKEPRDSVSEEEEQQQPSNVIDRSRWMARVLQKHRPIQELKERIYPLYRAISFGEYFDVGHSEVKKVLKDDDIMQLILQHLKFEGLNKTRKAIEKEANISAKNIDVDQSLLHAILKESIKASESIYDVVI